MNSISIWKKKLLCVGIFLISIISVVFGAVSSAQEAILIIAPNPQSHDYSNVDAVMALRAFDASFEAGNNTILLFGNDGIESPWIIGLSNNVSEENTKPATKENILYYLKSPNLLGVYYSGDGNINNLITADNQLLSYDDLKGINFNGRTKLIFCACLDFNSPFVSNLYAQTNPLFYSSGLTVLSDGPNYVLSSEVFINYVINGQIYTDAVNNAKNSSLYSEELSFFNGVFPNSYTGVWGIIGDGSYKLYPPVPYILNETFTSQGYMPIAYYYNIQWYYTPFLNETTSLSTPTSVVLEWQQYNPENGPGPSSFIQSKLLAGQYSGVLNLNNVMFNEVRFRVWLTNKYTGVCSDWTEIYIDDSENVSPIVRTPREKPWYPTN